jgi:hypothetical protein
VSANPLSWHLEILERAKKNLLKEQYAAALTRLDMVIVMLRGELPKKHKAMERSK